MFNLKEKKTTNDPLKQQKLILLKRGKAMAAKAIGLSFRVRISKDQLFNGTVTSAIPKVIVRGRSIICFWDIAIANPFGYEYKCTVQKIPQR